MEREEHENLLNELNSPDLEASRRTEILTALRNDYNDVIVNHEEITTVNKKLEATNNDLVVANSKLFRQAGIMGNEEMEQKEEQKEFSETITISEIERNVL